MRKQAAIVRHFTIFNFHRHIYKSKIPTDLLPNSAHNPATKKKLYDCTPIYQKLFIVLWLKQEKKYFTLKAMSQYTKRKFWKGLTAILKCLKKLSFLVIYQLNMPKLTQDHFWSKTEISKQFICIILAVALLTNMFVLRLLAHASALLRIVM